MSESLGPFESAIGTLAACVAELLALARGTATTPMPAKYNYPPTNTTLQNEGLALINLTEEMLAYYNGQGGSGGTVTSVSVLPTLPSLTGAGQTQQFTAVVKDANGNVLTPGVNGVPAIVWSSSNLTSATINATTGLATEVGNGSTTITATCGIRGGGTVLTTSGAATPVPTFVTVSPATASLTAANATRQFTATVQDQSHNPLTPGVGGVPALVWSSLSTSVATINSSTGLATELANGTATIKCICGSAFGTAALTCSGVTPPPGTPTTVTVSPVGASLTGVGQTQQYAAVVLDQNRNVLTPGSNGCPALVWNSSNGGSATINSSTGLATETGNGSTTITATCTPASGSTTLSTSGVAGGGGIGPNAPSGLTVTIDTGKMTGTPATTTNGTWQTSNNGTTNTWTNLTTLTSTTNPAYLLPAPGSGIRQKYDTTVPGGNNAVTFGTPMAQVNCTTLYLKAKVRFVNWSIVGAAGTTLSTSCPKLMEPRCGGPGGGANGTENHVLNTASSSNGDSYAWFSKQINAPTNSFENYVRFDVAPFSDVSVLTPKAALNFAAGNYTMVEWIVTLESTPGTSGDARVQYFVNGAAAYDSASTGVGGGNYGSQGSFNLLAPGDVKQWFYLLFNSCYGGALPNNGPARTMYYDVDEIYAGYK